MKYVLELSEEQCKVLKIALEEYFRLRMNQTWDFAESICFEDFDRKNYSKKDFDERIEKRDTFRTEFEKLLNDVHPLFSKERKYRAQTQEMLIAQDIWQVIRHKLYIDSGGDPNGWCVDAKVPMSVSKERLPVMKGEKE